MGRAMGEEASEPFLIDFSIPSNIAYLESIISTTSSRVKCVGVSLLISGLVVQFMNSLYMFIMALQRQCVISITGSNS